MERVLVSHQPIYRDDMAELGYELLFRNSDRDQATFADGDQATAEVIINTFMDIGLDAMVGRRLAFINFDRNLILGSYCECLPHDRVVLELLEKGNPDGPLITKLQTLRTAGYHIALDDFSAKESSSALLELASFVKIDVETNDWSAVERSLALIRKHPAKPSVITPKAANSYQFKTGHSTSVRDKSFYSFGVRSGKNVLILRVCKFLSSRRALWKVWKAFCAFQAACGNQGRKAAEGHRI
jgi:c-di-GMP-related signal transduction protein